MSVTDSDLVFAVSEGLNILAARLEGRAGYRKSEGRIERGDELEALADKVRKLCIEASDLSTDMALADVPSAPAVAARTDALGRAA